MCLNLRFCPKKLGQAVYLLACCPKSKSVYFACNNLHYAYMYRRAMQTKLNDNSSKLMLQTELALIKVSHSPNSKQISLWEAACSSPRKNFCVFYHLKQELGQNLFGILQLTPKLITHFPNVTAARACSH